MAKFSIRIEETLARVVEREAENIEDAISIVKRDYKDEKLILDTNDYVETSFEPLDNLDN